MTTAATGQVLRYRGPRRHADLVAARALSLGFVLTQFSAPSGAGWTSFTATLPGPIRWVELFSLVEVLAHTTDPYAGRPASHTGQKHRHECQETGLLVASG